MRTLKFNVKDQILEQDPFCDFSGLVPGTKEYVRAMFSFSQEWNGFAKVVSFWSMLGKEYPPMILKDGYTCLIPAEALAKRAFKIQVMGKKDDLKLITNKIAIQQNGGRK